MPESDTGVDLLSELVAWARVRNVSQLKVLLEQELQKKSDYIIYAGTDGTKSQADLAKLAGVNQSTVSRKWKTWKGLGLVYETSRFENLRHLISPQSLGLKSADE